MRDRIHKLLDGRRRRSIVGLVVAAVAVLAFFAASAFGILAGSPSKFESSDGNMVVDTTGDADWNSVAAATPANPNYVHLSDVFSSTGDDSFKSGQKQDTTCPVINTNKNPPKDDFTDVASFNETNLDALSPQFRHTFLYGATIRVAANGNASENVELNKGTNGLCTGSTTQLARSKGDKLIAIDYKQGGTAVDFHVLTWIVDNSDPANSTCFVSNDSPPCWGANVQTLSANSAEGKVNQTDIAAADNKINNKDLVAGQFAEFGVDLTAAGIIPENTCQGFAQTIWESRASGSSFVSSTEDVSLEQHTISNCGQVIIRKVTDPSPDPTNTTFQYTTTGGLDPATFGLKNGQKQDYGTTVLPGSYSVTETDPGPTFKLTKLTCTNSIPTTDVATRTVSFTLSPGDVVDCTYTNTRQVGALRILKNSTKTGTAVKKAGAVFSYDNSSVTDNGTGDEDSDVGEVCVSGLALGDYTVKETTPPSGYGGDSSSKTATVISGTNCTDNQPKGADVVTFTDPPLADIQVRFRDGGSGETKLDAPIACDNATGTANTDPTAGWDNTHTVTGIEAGATTITVTCTVKIDP
jgi:hypothetical protein